jgi:HK97 family phage prohead protease
MNLSMIKEYRFAPSNLKIQDTDAGTDGSNPDANKLLRGYAMVFNSQSELLPSKTGSFREIIPSNCKITFDDTRALWNHNDDMPLGAVFNGTLKLTPDKTGVYFELSPDRLRPEQLETIKLGEARMSFGFFTNNFKSAVNAEGESLRILTDITVFEVSPVIFPAYSATTVSLRSVSDEEIEALMTTETNNEDDKLEFVRSKLRLGLGVLKIR